VVEVGAHLRVLCRCVVCLCRLYDAKLCIIIKRHLDQRARFIVITKKKIGLIARRLVLR
jgi:hypothetical protein